MRVLRGLAALTLTGLACAAAYAGLRSAGFQPRWQVRPPPSAQPAAAPAPPAARVPPAASAAAGGADASTTLAGGVPAGGGRYERIEFETYGDGSPVRSNTAAAEQWRGQGLVLSFESYTAEATRPHVLDARGYFPPGASMHALAPPLAGERGLEVGVIHLDFPLRPRKVAFTIFGPDLIEAFEIIVWSRGERLPASARAHVPDERYADGESAGSGKATYRPGGRSRFRAERVVVEAAGGIDRVSLDGWGPPGHILLLDHLEIDP